MSVEVGGGARFWLVFMWSAAGVGENVSPLSSN